MRKFFVLLTSLVAFSLFFPVEHALAAGKYKLQRSSKVNVKKYKTAKTKAKKVSKSKVIRVRHASKINNPKEGEELKLESIARDFSSNEQ